MISPLEAARAAAAIDLPPELSHTLVILALFFPEVRPTQDYLARLLHVSRSTVIRRLAELERLGRIRRTRGRTGRATFYRVNLHDVVSPVCVTQMQHQEQPSTSSQDDDWTF